LNLAVHHRDHGVFGAIGFRNFHDKLGAFDARHGAVRDDFDAPGLVTMEERNDAAHQMQPGEVIAAIRRENFDFGERAEGHHTFVRPAKGDAAVATTAQFVRGVQHLIRLCEHPGRRADRHDFHLSLQFNDANLLDVGFSGGARAERRRAGDASRKNQAWQDTTCVFPRRIHIVMAACEVRVHGS